MSSSPTENLIKPSAIPVSARSSGSDGYTSAYRYADSDGNTSADAHAGGFPADTYSGSYARAHAHSHAAVCGDCHRRAGVQLQCVSSKRSGLTESLAGKPAGRPEYFICPCRARPLAVCGCGVR